MRTVILINDNREAFKDYANSEPHFGPAPTALLEGLALLPEAEIHVVSCVRKPVTAPKKIGPNIFYHRVVVPKLGWMRTLYLGCIMATRKKIKEIGPDIVHGQGTERDCAISAVFSGFPNVLTIHGNMQAIAQLHGARIGSFHWLAARLETFALRRTRGVFCNSAYTEDLVSPHAPRTWRVANALRLEFFEPLPAPQTSAVPVLLNVGVIQPRKQQLQLLAVARRLHERGWRFELQFAGPLGGSSQESTFVQGFIRELAVAEKAGYARHIGNLSAVQLVKAMDAASALVHFPSEEAFGLVVVEALARNLKFFGAATGGIVDIAGGVELAELIPPGDFAGLEIAVDNWLKADRPRPRSAAPLMRKLYHPEVIARQHLKIYQRVLHHQTPLT